jgi:hypothetical protein
MLDPRLTFSFNRSVSADDPVTSLIGLHPAGVGKHGAAVFATTHWSVVLQAQSETPAAQDALEKLCRTYWRPLYSFVRRQGLSPEDAQDLIQEFFARFLERKSLGSVHERRGVYDHICLSRLNVLSPPSGIARAVLNGTRRGHAFLWRNWLPPRTLISNWQRL